MPTIFITVGKADNRLNLNVNKSTTTCMWKPMPIYQLYNLEAFKANMVAPFSIGPFTLY